MDLRDLFRALRTYDGTRAVEDMFASFVAEDRDFFRPFLAKIGMHDSPWVRDPELLDPAYLLSRLNDVLLLGFQPELDSGLAVPWAHELHLVGCRWPAIPVERYLDLFAAFDMRPVTDERFDPVVHEIVEVEQAADPDAPITVTELVWPGLMYDELVFSRAGVKVRAGVHHAEHGVADRFPLYWTFLRRYRPTNDLSLGWGGNSQWGTDFRRDYRTDEAVYLNVDGWRAEARPRLDHYDQRLTDDERRDLVRHRCLLRTPASQDELDAEHRGWPMEMWPFDEPLTVPTERSTHERA